MTYTPKTTGTIRTNDLFTRKQIQKIAIDQ